MLTRLALWFGAHVHALLDHVSAMRARRRAYRYWVRRAQIDTSMPPGYEKTNPFDFKGDA